MKEKNVKNITMKLWSILKYSSIAILTLSVAAALLLAIGVPNIAFFSLKSESMNPALKIGSVIVVKNSSVYNNGDIITFKNSGGTTTTHRIVASLPENNYHTKGDANSTRDPFPVSQPNIIGKVVLHIPLVGYFSDFIRSKTGLIVTIFFPAFLVIFDEIKNIVEQIRRLSVRKKKKTRFAPLVILFGFIFIGQKEIIQSTNSYFIDSAHLSNNFTVFEYFLDFYFREDYKAVGFTLDNISGITKIDYSVKYTKTDGVLTGTEGSIDNSSLSEHISKEWILLGSCSGLGEVCWYDNINSPIELTVKLTKPDTTEVVLTKELNL